MKQIFKHVRKKERYSKEERNVVRREGEAERERERKKEIETLISRQVNKEDA